MSLRAITISFLQYKQGKDKDVMNAIRPAALGILLCLFSTGLYANDILQQADKLLSENKAEEAYTLLIAESEQLAGTPDFDLLLGIAALNSGHPTQAVFALERVLALQPDNDRARAELARAYFEMGENEAAKDEFTAVKEKPLPASVAESIDKYLSAIEARFASTRTRFDVYIQGALGYDSNANSAQDSSQIAIPAFGNLLFNVNPAGQETDSGFFELEAGIIFATPFLNQDNLHVIGKAGLNQHVTFTDTDFRTATADGQLGLRYSRDKNAFLVSLVGEEFRFGGQENREQGGVNGQWLHSFGQRTLFSASAQYLAQRFPGQPVRNVNQLSGSLGAVHALAGDKNPIIFANAFGGTDYELNDLRPDIGRDFVGARLGGQFNWDNRTIVIGSAGYQYSRYGGPDPLFNERRRDHFVFLRAAVEYALTRNWTLTPEIQYSNNDSSLDINEYDRWQAFITMRNLF